MTTQNKRKLIFNTIMEKIVIWGTVFFVIFMILRRDMIESNIQTEGNIKYNTYIAHYIKSNPDMVDLINREKNCYTGKIYAVEGCGAYIYKDTSIEQQMKLYEYNKDLNKIVMETNNKLKN